MRLPPLHNGLILDRYKRFLADIALESGRVITAHCPNTGSMTGCWRPGAPAQVSCSDRPGRKLPYTLERVDMGAGWIGVHTGRVNQLIREGIESARLPSLSGYRWIRNEPRFGSAAHPLSRFDLLLGDGDRPDALVEIKNTTLLCGDAVQFPDAVTERGRRHLTLLAEAVRRGYRGVIVFAVNRPEGSYFEPAWHIDPTWAETLEQVVEQGVEVVVARLKHTPLHIEVAGATCFP